MSLLETPIMPSPNSLKRSYDTAELETPRLSQEFNENLPQPFSNDCVGMSPIQSSIDSVLTTPQTSRAQSVVPSDMSPLLKDGSVPRIAASPSKRKKLTVTEREIQKIEKQFKDQQKAEEKARKEAEKRAKDEERRIKEESLKEERGRKEAEKEEKRKIREAEKQAKEAERKAKEDEKAKKERSQLRLNSFFVKSAPTFDNLSSSSGQDNGISSRRSSLASIDALPPTARSRSTSTSPDVCKRDYDRKFPSFFLQSHTKLAPLNRFLSDLEQPNNSIIIIDDELRRPGESRGSPDVVKEKTDVFTGFLRQPLHKRRKQLGMISVKSVIAALHGTAVNPIDLTGPDCANVKKTPEDLLKSIRVKYLRFAEDVRPPYIGTYTKKPQGYSISKVCKKPFTRALPAINYDYDSEAEWEEPGEGEDLDSEGEEESGDEEVGDDLKEFLDDDEAGEGMRNSKRRHIMGDVQPISTGLCWEDTSGGSQNLIVTYGQSSLDLRPFRLDTLLAQPQMPIDPYSTSYWPAIVQPEPSKLPPARADPSNMAPPSRIPLTTVSTSNTLFPINHLSTDTTSKPSKPKPTTSTTKAPRTPSKPLPPEILEEFKHVVQGNDLTKAGLIEVLKKQFPKASKDTIKDTLGQIAERVGSKEADKRWVLKV